MTGTVADASVRLLGLSLRRDDAEALRCGGVCLVVGAAARAGRPVRRGAGVLGRTAIAVLDMNDSATIEAADGASRAGSVLTVVNRRLAPEELAYVLSDSESELLLVGVRGGGGGSA